jgi:glutamate carboxypeptidase
VPGVTPPPATDYPFPLLRRLVDQVAGSTDVAEMQALNGVLGAFLAECGFTVHRVPNAGFADVLDAWIGPEDAPVVTLVAHTDTVWPAGFDPSWRMRVDEQHDRISGPGVGDMKASILMAALGCRDVVERGARVRCRLLCISDEEVGSVGSRAFIESCAAGTVACIGLEAAKPGLAAVASRGAVGAMRVVAEGLAAHVTDPAARNATAALVEIAHRIAVLPDDGVAANVCRFVSGASRQIAAAHGELEIDLRADTTDRMGARVAAVHQIAADVGREHDITVTVLGGVTRPAFPATASAPLVALLARLGAPVDTVHEAGGSDASFLAAMGVPTLDGLGVECFDNCSPTEAISITSIGIQRRRIADLLTALADEAA